MFNKNEVMEYLYLKNGNRVLKGNLGKSKSYVYVKVHEHSSTSALYREALELQTKRNLKLQLVNGTSSESGPLPLRI